MRRYDLHTHTRASFDCRTDWTDYIDAVISSGLRGVAVTDHDTMDGALRLRDKRPSFDVIVGCEFTLESGAHLIGLRLEQPIKAGSLEETSSAIREQGGIVVLPHPFRPVTGALALIHNKPDWEGVLESIDAIEAFNAKSSWFENSQSLELARKWDIPVTAGSDAHRAAEIGTGAIQAPVDFSNGGLGTITGIDQTSPLIQARRRSQERARHNALKFKRAIPEPVWKAGKRAWSAWMDLSDEASTLPHRDYGWFPSAIRGSVTAARLQTTSGEHQ